MKLPVYNAYISDDENEGLLVMSLVQYPATEFNWLCFSKDTQLTKFSIQDEEQHILCGLVMSCNQPIYRRDEDGYEYYIQYDRKTLEIMAEKMLYYNNANNIDLQHNGQILPKGAVVIRELFFKDSERGVVPKGFENLNDGSLLCTYKVNNEELWNMCKDGTFNGFSLSGLFSVKPQEFKKHNNNNMIKDILKKFLTNFSETAVGDKKWLHDGELEVGTKVTNEDGSTVEDGEYTLEDGTKITIKDGAVENVEKPAEETTETSETETTETSETADETHDETSETETSEETTETETTEETTSSEDPSLQAEVDALKSELEALKNSIEEIKTSVNEALTAPVAAPAVEEFEQVETKTHKGSNTSNILSHLK